MVICRSCDIDKCRSEFSSRQLYGPTNRTCKICTSSRRQHEQRHSRSRSPDSHYSSSRSSSRSSSPGYDSPSYGSGSYDDSEDDERAHEENADISDVRYSGVNLEGFLANHGWELHDDRGTQGVYYRSDGQSAMLTIWYQTGRYRTKLDRDVHPSGENNQMFGPKDAAGRRVIDDIKEVAQDVRTHTNNRYSDRHHQ